VLLVRRATGSETRLIPSGRLPGYSKETVDIEVLQGNHEWREVATACGSRPVKTAQHYGAERCRGWPATPGRWRHPDGPQSHLVSKKGARVAGGSPMGQRRWDASCCWLPWRRIRLSTRNALPMLTIASEKGN
jgi:hypothetical protein